MIIVVAYTDRGAGNDPKTFFFFFFFLGGGGGGGGERRGVLRPQGSTFLRWAIWE